MNSQDYWRKREEKWIAQQIKDDAKQSKTIAEKYQRALDQIEKEISANWERFAGKEGVTLSEAKKMAYEMDVKAFARKAKQYVKDKDFSKTANDELRLYNVTMRVNRLELLKSQIGLELVALSDDIDKYTADTLTKTGLAEATRQAGILGETVFQGYQNFVESVAFASFNGATFSERIWGNNQALKADLDRLLVRSITQGRNPRELARELRNLFDSSKYEAERLMRTETARMQMSIQQKSYLENDIDEFEFVAEPSACGVCKPLDGKTFKVAKMESGLNAAPMHPNCVLPDTKIIAPDIEAMTRSEYSGDVIEAILSDGTRLTVTPNHIVLTTRGWVRAKFLTQADNVISYGGWDKSAVETGSYPTNNDSIATAEQLFTALVEASGGSTSSVPATAVDFKGDVVADSKVDIVFINSELRNKLNPSIIKFVSDVFLVDTIKGAKGFLPAERTFAEFLVCTGIAADGIMSSGCISDIFRFSSFTHHDLVSLRLASDYDTRLQKTIADNRPTNSEFFSDSIFADSRSIQRYNSRNINASLNGAKSNAFFSEDIANFSLGDSVNVGDFLRHFAGLIKINNVVNVATRYYSGHVYDASSMSTLYTANGVITSNCRCSTVPSV